MRPSLLLSFSSLLLAGGCRGPGVTIPLDGAYTRGAFHLMLDCAGEAVPLHEADLLYPLNTEAQTWTFAEAEDHQISISWDGVLLGTGLRAGDGVDFVLDRHDRFTPPPSHAWRFHGRIRDDLVFHERTIAGNIYYGTLDDGDADCRILPRSVAWFTTRPRALDRDSVGFARNASGGGDWNRFVWFMEVGPLAMEKKGNPTQPGNNLALFSFLSTGGGRVVTGDAGAFVDDGLPQDGSSLHPASAKGSAVEYASTNADWQVRVFQDVVFDDGMPVGTSPGIRRVLAGWVTGDVRVDASIYPPGFSGPTGPQALQIPGMAFFTDIDHGPAAAAFAPATRITRPPGAGAASVVWDGTALP